MLVGESAFVLYNMYDIHPNICGTCTSRSYVLVLQFVYLPCMNISTHILKQMHAARVGVT